MRRRPIPLAAALFAAALAALLGGCAGHREAVPDNVGFHELRESFGDRDLSPLEGRRVLLDPGHGGVFPGVIGLDGLSEAEVNLGVALWLRGLLEAAGAEVFMTRSADVDLLTPADSTLAADLNARSALCDSLRPDVFLSLHHNSNAALDRDMNETQTYYPVGREGADLDLARSIHKHLVRNLEIEPARIMAGNFSVLRNATVPAVLGEPAMLSHPGVEKKLSAAGKQRLEAEAYFLGLLEYFEGGAPFWMAEFDTIRGADDKVLSWRFGADRLHPDSGPGLDPTSVELRIDGQLQNVDIDLDANRISLFRVLVGTRPIDFELTGRNLEGRSTATYRFEMPPTRRVFMPDALVSVIDGKRRDIVLSWSDSRINRGRAVLHEAGDVIRGRILNPDRADRGVCLVREADVPSNPMITVYGHEDLYGVNGIEQELRGWSRLELSSERPFRWCLLTGPDHRLDIPGDRYRIRKFPGCRSWKPINLKQITRRPAFPVVEDLPAWLEIRGARPILMDATHRTPWQEPCDSPRDTIVWHPLVPELVGKTIVIDPHGGAADADGVAPMGTPGRELNLRVAERLAHLLRGAGAEAVLTRDDPGWVPPEAKVLMANEADADLFITLRRSDAAGPAWRVAHHYGSRGGSAWAGYLAQTLGRLAAPDTVAIAEAYAYLLRHTACPAVDVSLPMPADLDAEELWRAPAYQQAVASELLNATAAWFQGPDLLTSLADPRTFMVERQLPWKPVELEGLDWIRVDGNWLWLPPRDDAIPPARLPLPGIEHSFEARRGEAWELYVSGYGEGDRIWVRPFWTSEHQPTNPYATTEPVDEADAP